MKKGKVTLLAQTILTFDAGSHEAIKDGGNTYILLQQEDGFSEEETVKADTPKVGKAEPKAEVKEEAPVETATQETTSDDDESKGWTEEEMMEMDANKDLLPVCERLGIDPNATKGRNTNKKLRTLILDYWANSSDVVDDAPAETTQTEKAEASSDSSDDTPKEIPEANWRDLEAGDTVYAKLDMEGEDGEKLWEAEIVEWKKPKGGTEEKLYVYFIEDEQEDYLREGDKLFEYKVAL